MGIKLVKFHPSDATLSIPAHNAIILLSKPENREPQYFAVATGSPIPVMHQPYC